MSECLRCTEKPCVCNDLSMCNGFEIPDADTIIGPGRIEPGQPLSPEHQEMIERIVKDVQALGERQLIDKRYVPLREVLDRAYARAAYEKGRERHAAADEDFTDQVIITIGQMLGNTSFQLGQAIKKILESTRLPLDASIRERLDAIVYLAASIIGDELKARMEAK